MEMDSIETIRSESEVGYTAYSGIEITAIGEGWCEACVHMEKHHLNPSGAAHGGIIFALGDVAGGVAFKTLGGLPTTLSSNITYFRPFLGDSVIYARADVVKFGKTTGFVNVQLLNEKKVECARIAATYYNMKGRKQH